MSAIVTKVDVIHRVAAARGYRHYLEVCTPSTGGRFNELDHARFATAQRLLYRCAPDFDDGQPVDYRIADDGVAGFLRTLGTVAPVPDIALVDSWHDYVVSRRDLVGVFALLPEGGAMIVHDCRPPRAEVAAPDPIPGEWCGTTYKAYLDFVLERPDLDYVTVDTDYGCGVVTKRATGGKRGEGEDRAARRAKAAATRLSEMIRRATEMTRAGTSATPRSEILPLPPARSRDASSRPPTRTAAAPPSSPNGAPSATTMMPPGRSSRRTTGRSSISSAPTIFPPPPAGEGAFTLARSGDSTPLTRKPTIEKLRLTLACVTREMQLLCNSREASDDDSAQDRIAGYLLVLGPAQPETELLPVSKTPS